MFRFYAPIMYGVTDGVIGAAEGATTAAVGAVILTAAGIPYDIGDAAKLGALGKAALSAYVAARSKKLFNCGFFAKPHNKIFSFSNAFLSSSYLGLQVVSGMLGAVISNFANNNQEASSQDMFDVMLLGSAIMLVPIWLVDSYLYAKISPTLNRFANTLKLLDDLDEPESSVQNNCET